MILIGMVTISANDALIKQLSGGYPLHQMVFVRSAIGIWFSLVLVWFEGGFSILRTRHWGFHLFRGLALVVANISFFTALAVMPLGEATALFFVAPLMITLLSVPLLGERGGSLPARRGRHRLCRCARHDPALAGWRARREFGCPAAAGRPPPSPMLCSRS